MNLPSFLSAIALSELGPDIIRQSDNGYNVLVGSLPDMVLTFSSYHRHPGVLLDMDGKVGGLQSTAAGRFQLLARYWKPYCKILGLNDFSPDSQVKIACQQLKERGTLSLIQEGRIEEAVLKANKTWASLPGSPYGQHTVTMDQFLKYYRDAGGVVKS